MEGLAEKEGKHLEEAERALERIGKDFGDFERLETEENVYYKDHGVSIEVWRGVNEGSKTVGSVLEEALRRVLGSSNGRIRRNQLQSSNASGKTCATPSACERAAGFHGYFKRKNYSLTGGLERC